MRSLLLAFAACLVGLLSVSGIAFAASQKSAILVVTNPTSLSRPEEVLEIPLAAIESKLPSAAPADLRVEDLATHKPLPVQLDGSKPGASPDRLLVLVGLTEHQTIRLAIHSAQEPAAFTPMVYGRIVPERKDDFAWENDQVAFRVYGPALQATGEITSGIDVWSKRVPDLIVNAWYNRDAEGQRTHNSMLSYHKDAGQGLDSYDVGPTRGCGGTGLWKDGRLSVSKNYLSAEVLAGGPIRFRFRLRYAPWMADGVEVSEEKIVTLDAGSHLNRIESTFFFRGAQSSARQTAQWAAGLAMHQGAHVMASDGILSVWEPLTDPGAGMDGTAIVLEPGRTSETTQASGNALLLLPAMPGAPIAYYAGAAWSKSSIPDEAAWNHYLQEFRGRLAHPLKTRWK
jgi:hypothetical protein